MAGGSRQCLQPAGRLYGANQRAVHRRDLYGASYVINRRRADHLAAVAVGDSGLPGSRIYPIMSDSIDLGSSRAAQARLAHKIGPTGYRVLIVGGIILMVLAVALAFVSSWHYSLFLVSP